MSCIYRKRNKVLITNLLNCSKFLLSLAVLISGLLVISHANWADLEQIMLTISFDSSESSLNNYSLFLVNGSEQSEIVELIKNPYYKQGLNNWDYLGEVEANFSRDSYIKISSEHNSAFIEENCVIQNLDLTDQSLAAINLAIEYQWFTKEELIGFDQVAFAVLLDSKLIHLQPVLQNQLNSRQTSIISLPLKEEAHQLKVCAGNTGDRSQSSWIHLYSVSTKVAVLNNNQQLLVEALEAEIEARYVVNSKLKKIKQNNSLLINFDEPLDGNKLVLDFTNSDQGLITRAILPTFVYPNQPSAPAQASVCNVNPQEAAVAFSQADIPDQTISWELESVETEGEDTDITARFNHYSSWPVSLVNPSCPNGKCLIFFDLQNDNNLDLDFSTVELRLRSCDVTGICSEWVELQRASNCSKLLSNNLSEVLPILINEIMFNPLGNDNGHWYEGEWVELFNPNSFDIDVAGWRVEDEAGWVIEIEQGSADNNHDITDGGETIIPAGEYLAVFTQGRAIFNNTGDTAFLFDDLGNLIDEVQHPGSSVEDKTYGRYPDGSEHFYPRMLSTPLAPNQLE